MANMKPESQKSLKEKLAIIDKLSDSINKSEGKTIMGRIGRSEEIAEKLRIKFIPTVSSELNDMMGGGYPRGRTTLIAGVEDSGKTSRVLEDIGYNMQKDPNFVAGWLESEGSLEESYLRDVMKIDLSRFVYFEIDKDNGAESALDKAESLIASKTLDILVVNSLKCLTPKKEYVDSFSDNNVGLQARMNNKMTRKFTAIVSEANLAYVLITHLHTDIAKASSNGGKGDPYTISGGLGIKFGASITLDFRKRSVADSDPISKIEGLKIHVSQRKNHCTPGKNIYLQLDYFVIFGEGTEQMLSVQNSALEQGIFTLSGAWINWIDEDGKTVKNKWQGKEKYRAFMRENPDVFEEIKSLIKPKNMSLLQIEQIKKQDKNFEEDDEEVNEEALEETLKDAISDAVSTK